VRCRFTASILTRDRGTPKLPFSEGIRRFPAEKVLMTGRSPPKNSFPIHSDRSSVLKNSFSRHMTGRSTPKNCFAGHSDRSNVSRNCFSGHMTGRSPPKNSLLDHMNGRSASEKSLSEHLHGRSDPEHFFPEHIHRPPAPEKSSMDHGKRNFRPFVCPRFRNHPAAIRAGSAHAPRVWWPAPSRATRAHSHVL
jgi:hypothetical protein